MTVGNSLLLNNQIFSTTWVPFIGEDGTVQQFPFYVTTSPYASPYQTPVASPANSPYGSPVQTPVPSPGHSPNLSPVQTPGYSPCYPLQQSFVNPCFNNTLLPPVDPYHTQMGALTLPPPAMNQGMPPSPPPLEVQQTLVTNVPLQGNNQVWGSNTQSNVSSWGEIPFQVDPLQISAFEILYELEVTKHDATEFVATVKEFQNEINEAMKSFLGQPHLDIQLHVNEQGKSTTLCWEVDRASCDFEALQTKDQTKHFKEQLICELALVGNGVLNKHLHSSKQLSIIYHGFKVFNMIKHALESFNESKDKLLEMNPEDLFDEENTQHLFRVCEAEKGRALRGDNVLGGHFRGDDVPKMTKIVEIVEQEIGTIERATMIPSMKGRSQYKGWSIYIETPSVGHVERIIEKAYKKGIFKRRSKEEKKKELFIAVDKYDHRRRN